MAKNPGRDRRIVVGHINIRQSISILVIRIILIEIIADSVYLLLCYSLLCREFTLPGRADVLIFSALKLALIIFVILQWLNDYCEITPNAILHRKGIIFRTEEKYELVNLKLIGMKQGFIGKILNFGTITLYDWFLKKHSYLYLIHNPQRYFRILKDLVSKTDEETHFFISEAHEKNHN